LEKKYISKNTFSSGHELRIFEFVFVQIIFLLWQTNSFHFTFDWILVCLIFSPLPVLFHRFIFALPTVESNKAAIFAYT